MGVLSYTLFDTALGPCGLAWSANGITGVQLPEADEARTRSRLLRRQGRAEQARPPTAVQGAVDGIAQLLRGQPTDLGTITLDMTGVPTFNRRVYDIARGIAPGRTLTYGDIAARLGDHGLARAVGQALGNNPFAIIVPCHRVLAARGKPGGFSANGGVQTKMRLLAIEGARVGDAPDLFGPGLPDL